MPRAKMRLSLREGAVRRQVLALLAALATLLSIAPCPPDARAEETRAEESRAGETREAPVPVYVFWQTGCPYCERALSFLETRPVVAPPIELVALELSGSSANQELFFAALEHFRIDRAAVPTIVVGDRVFTGFDGPETSGAAIARKIADCAKTSCPDIVGSWRARGSAPPPASGETSSGTPASTKPEARPAGLPEIVTLPLIGDLALRELSLPVLTVVLAAIDGFNPCAMWVLVFLIGLLIGVRDRFRMWALGAVFLVASGAVYFAFMAAWLNLVLLLGALIWLRLAVGVLALGGGAYNIREFLRNPDGACAVTDLEGRQRLRERFRAAVGERRFVVAALGVAALAVAVNMIELLCSAGIPAVYAQVLSLSDLSVWENYLYLTLYILVFLLDDFVVFVTAMLSLQAAGATTVYSRYSHLIGGVILVAIGGMLVFRPEWLSFSVG